MIDDEETMDTPFKTAITQALYAAFFLGDAVILEQLLADAIELRAPTDGASWFGKSLVLKLIEHASAVFHRFDITDEIFESDTLIARFDATIDSNTLTGAALVRLNANTEIELIEIFSRPPSTATRMYELMNESIASDPEMIELMDVK